jgi:hypothetical protein
VAGIAAVLVVLSAAAIRAEDDARPGPDDGTKPWILNSNNWEVARELLPEVVLNRVKTGDYWFQVVPVDPERFKQNYGERFWKASAANAGKFDVDGEICGLKEVATGKIPADYFGYPFPDVDPADPQAGCKMAWNFNAASELVSGGGATFTLNGVDRRGEFRRIKSWGETAFYQGRSAGPIANPDNLRFAGMTSVIEPRDIDGVAGLARQHNDWTSQDQAWFYVPATRRVRRVDAANRSEPVAGLDIYYDDFNCYSGKIEFYKWKLAGEGKVLAPVLSPYPIAQKRVGPTRWEIESIPYFKAAYETPGADGAPWLVVENLQMVPRPVWILEGQSDDPYYSFGKVIMYMDRDMYRIYWKLVHNRAGEYFYNAMCAYHWSRNADGTFTAVSPNLVVGVNDKTNRAALGGRYSSQFFEMQFPRDHFSLRTLSRLSD